MLHIIYWGNLVTKKVENVVFLGFSHATQYSVLISMFASEMHCAVFLNIAKPQNFWLFYLFIKNSVHYYINLEHTT